MKQMNILTIYFKDGDAITREVVDATLQNGFLLVVYKEFSEDSADPCTEAFNTDLISSFDMIRMKGEEDDEGISGE